MIYRPEESDVKHRYKEMVSKPDDAKLPGMRELAILSADGYSVSADIPASIPAYCFAIIDMNGYMQYSKVVKAQKTSKK